jgi:hypothetical protein
MRSIVLVASLSVATLAMTGGPALAHGGGLNAEGCHNNKKTGDYHCHRSPAPAPAKKNSSVSYANCTEARQAGASNIRRGQPGYASHLDRDNDGLACEK